MQGPPGEDGIDGVDGPQGAQGADGPQGSQGPVGPQGADGATGAQGPHGPRGATGAGGEDGIDGIDGAQGPRGPQGFQGPQGSRGPKGPQGETGPAGVGRTGSSGAPGMMGVQGPQGPAGGGGGGPFVDLEVTNDLTVGNSITTGVVTNDGNIQIVATDTGNVLIEGDAGVVIEADSGAVAITASGGDVIIDTGGGDLIINGQPYSVGGQAIYGDGHQGDVVYSVDTQLDASVYANDVTVDPGVTVHLNNWPLYARGTLTNNGTIHNDGRDSIGNAGSSDDANDRYGIVAPGGHGIQGGEARGADGEIGLGYYKATFGTGGEGGDTNMFGGGPGADPDPWWNMQRSALGGGSIITNASLDATGPNSTTLARGPWAGGNGGGSGAGQGHAGGGGGMGGGAALLAARHLVNNGVIRAVGGAGGDAEDTSAGYFTWAASTAFFLGQIIQPSTHAYVVVQEGTSDLVEPTWTDNGDPVVDADVIWNDLGVPAAGGGGGGQGGNVFLIYDDFTGNEPTVDGGLGGAGFGDGADGDPGDTGHVIHLSNT